MRQQPASRVLRAVVPVLGDLAILLGALVVTIALRSNPLERAGLVQSFLPLFAIFIGLFHAVGLYELRRIRDFVSLVGGLLLSLVLCGAAGAIYFYVLTNYFAEMPKTYLLMTVVLAHAAMLVWRRAILLITGFQFMKMRLLVLASSEHLAHLRADQRHRFAEGLDLATELGPDVDMVVADSAWIEANWDKTKCIFSAAVSRGIPVVSLERFYEANFGKVSPAYAGDPAWALEHVLPRADGLYFKSRRVFDIVAAFCGLVLLSPLLLATAALIAWVDGMSPMYGQPRVGYLGRVFTLWKFRTMPPNADSAGPFQARRPGEPSATRLGAVLRRFRLDELLQLWNVLRGEMALVGPRPEWVKEVEVLEKVVPNYHLRHLVPPGITGWAQVYFHATSNPQDSIEKHHFDLYYIKHFSPALDLTILLKTAKRVFVSDSRIAAASAPFPRMMGRTAPAFDIASIVSRN